MAYNPALSIVRSAVSLRSLHVPSSAKVAILQHQKNMNMPLLPASVISQTQRGSARSFQTARCLSYSPSVLKGKQNSRPGWSGRHGDDHVLNRDALDAQSEPSHQSRQDKEKASVDASHKEGGQGVHEKDDGDHNKRAKEDHPEAPEPVIGMNSERGGKGH